MRLPPRPRPSALPGPVGAQPVNFCTEVLLRRKPLTLVNGDLMRCEQGKDMNSGARSSGPRRSGIFAYFRMLGLAICAGSHICFCLRPAAFSVISSAPSPPSAQKATGASRVPVLFPTNHSILRSSLVQPVADLSHYDFDALHKIVLLTEDENKTERSFPLSQNFVVPHICFTAGAHRIRAETYLAKRREIDILTDPRIVVITQVISHVQRPAVAQTQWPTPELATLLCAMWETCAGFMCGDFTGFASLAGDNPDYMCLPLGDSGDSGDSPMLPQTNEGARRWARENLEVYMFERGWSSDWTDFRVEPSPAWAKLEPADVVSNSLFPMPLVTFLSPVAKAELMFALPSDRYTVVTNMCDVGDDGVVDRESCRTTSANVDYGLGLDPLGSKLECTCPDCAPVAMPLVKPGFALYQQKDWPSSLLKPNVRIVRVSVSVTSDEQSGTSEPFTITTTLDVPIAEVRAGARAHVHACARMHLCMPHIHRHNSHTRHGRLVQCLHGSAARGGEQMVQQAVECYHCTLLAMTQMQRCLSTAKFCAFFRSESLHRRMPLCGLGSCTR